MKINKFFMGLFGALAVAACSVDGPVDNGKDSPDVNLSDGFVSVSIEMPTSPGTRADDRDKYENGTANESAVTNAVFFFFDGKDACIDIQKKTSVEFKDPEKPSDNPYIEKYGIVELRLKSGLDYKKVAVVLNSAVSDLNNLQTEVMTVSDLLERSSNYLDNINSTPGNDFGKGQTMSNSVYYDTKDRKEAPASNQKVSIVPITAKNIYTSAERPNIEDLMDPEKTPDPEKRKEYVEIFVERIVARVDVETKNFKLDEYYVSEETAADGSKTKKKTVTFYNTDDLTSKEIIIKPVIKGMILNVLAKEARLIKPINSGVVGYGKGDNDGYKNFQWNDPENKRSYWATTDFLNNQDLEYYSWEYVDGKHINEGKLTEFQEYIHPNTQAYKPVVDNENNSPNAKLMVVAELHSFDDAGEDKGAIDFVRFGADYMIIDNFYVHVANLVNTAVRSIKWDNANLDLDADKLQKVKESVAAAFVTGVKGNMFKLSLLNPEEDNKPGVADYEAVLSKDNLSYSLEDLDALTAEEKGKVVSKIDEIINATISTLNGQKILYWNKGKTYYYTNIRHQGFNGLVGGGESNFLFGVVRNHIYKIELSGIYGLGTPVIEPGRPIDPERPGNERPSFIQAKINILPWRVVTNDAIIH